MAKSYSLIRPTKSTSTQMFQMTNVIDIPVYIGQNTTTVLRFQHPWVPE